MNIDWDNRQWLALPGEMQVLERYATQAGNLRSRKPARFIWMYTLGRERQEILTDLRLSESKLEDYFQAWIDGGVPALTKATHEELYR